MRITRDTLSTVVYAVRKNMQGYTLLKNPKNSSQNEVNMIKKTFSIAFNLSDDVFRYQRIQRKKVNGKIVETKRNLTVTHYMDVDTKQITNKKEMIYSEYKNGVIEPEKCAERADISDEELVKRAAKTIFEEDEILKYTGKRFKDEHKKEFYKPAQSMLEKIIAFPVNLLKTDSRPAAPGFIETLVTNLKNGK